MFLLWRNDIEMNFPVSFPGQHQNIQPGLEFEMTPLPIYDDAEYNKKGETLKGKIAKDYFFIIKYI